MDRILALSRSIASLHDKLNLSQTELPEKETRKVNKREWRAAPSLPTNSFSPEAEEVTQHGKWGTMAELNSFKGAEKVNCAKSCYRGTWARLWDIPPFMNWNDACNSSSATTQGYMFARPSECVERFFAQYGHWYFYERRRCLTRDQKKDQTLHS